MQWVEHLYQVVHRESQHVGGCTQCVCFQHNEVAMAAGVSVCALHLIQGLLCADGVHRLHFLGGAWYA